MSCFIALLLSSLAASSHSLLSAPPKPMVAARMPTGRRRGVAPAPVVFGAPVAPGGGRERDALSEPQVLGVVLGVVIATLGALRATRFGDPPPWMPLREVLAGGVAAATTEIALYPVEVFKVRRQTGGAGKLPLLTTAGLAAGVLRGLCYHGLRLGLFPAVKNALGGDSLAARIASGAACGALGAALCNPLDLVKTRLQRDPERYPNSFAALVAVFEGGGAFVGSPATVLRAAAGSAAQLATYDSVKGAALASELPAALAVPVAVCCSSVAYCTAAAPMDVVKARLMVARDGDRSGVLACVRDLARTGGPAAFFKGWLPAVLRLLPVALFVFPARPRAETFGARAVQRSRRIVSVVVESARRRKIARPKIAENGAIRRREDRPFGVRAGHGGAARLPRRRRVLVVNLTARPGRFGGTAASCARAGGLSSRVALGPRSPPRGRGRRSPARPHTSAVSEPDQLGPWRAPHAGARRSPGRSRRRVAWRERQKRQKKGCLDLGKIL